MFFDCTALLAGLVASLISRWRPNSKYPYGSVSTCSLSHTAFSIYCHVCYALHNGHVDFFLSLLQNLLSYLIVLAVELFIDCCSS